MWNAEREQVRFAEDSTSKTIKVMLNYSYILFFMFFPLWDFTRTSLSANVAQGSLNPSMLAGLAAAGAVVVPWPSYCRP